MPKETSLNAISLLIVFKSFKSLKSPTAKNNLWITLIFGIKKKDKKTLKFVHFFLNFFFDTAQGVFLRWQSKTEEIIQANANTS